MALNGPHWRLIFREIFCGFRFVKGDDVHDEVTQMQFLGEISLIGDEIRCILPLARQIGLGRRIVDTMMQGREAHNHLRK